MISRPEDLTDEHGLSEFSCGKPALDRWLKTRALTNQQKGFTAVVVVHQEKRVVGFFGLSPTAVVADAMPRSVRTGQPPNPIPCLLLGQLATDLSCAGQGIASGLLKHALARCTLAARLIGGRALLVRALDSEAQDFWVRRGFRPTPDDPLLLVRSMQDIAVALRSAGLTEDEQ